MIDPAAGTASRSALGASLSGTIKWFGGALGVDAKIYGMPFDSTDILAIGTFRASFASNLLRSPYLNKL